MLVPSMSRAAKSILMDHLPVISNEFVTASVSSSLLAEIPESGSFP